MTGLARNVRVYTCAHVDHPLRYNHAMTFYNLFASRSRNRTGMWTKRLQARTIFQLGTSGMDDRKLSVLELGPGDGYIAELARARGDQYVAVEGSEAVARKLSQAGVAVIRSFVPPLPPLPTETGSLDVCYMLHVIEHIRDIYAAMTLVGEIREHLRPGGRLVIATPEFRYWKQDFYDSDYSHHLPFTRRTLLELLGNEGFDVTYQSIYTGPVFGYRSLPLYWLTRLVYPQWLDDLIGRHARHDVLVRGFWTLIPNLIVVAQKPA